MKNLLTLFFVTIIFCLASCGNETATPASATTNTTSTKKVTTPKTSTKNTVGIKAKNVSAKSGTEICVDVQVYDFNEILSMQYSTNWDTKALKYKGPKNMSLKYLSKQNFAKNGNEPGALRLSWYPQDLKEISLMNGTTIYQLCFDAIGASGTTTEVSFGSQPMIAEIVNAKNKFFQLEAQPTVVTIE